MYELSEEKSPSQQIIELIGEESETPLVPNSGTDPEQTLPPLHSVVDPDALDSLVASATDNSATATRIEFSYHGYTVRVCADRPTPTIRLQPENQQMESYLSVSADD